MSLDPNKTYLQWNGTTFPNSLTSQFKAPAGSSIDWGDGTVETFNTASTTINSHTYTDGKTNHTIVINGLLEIGYSAFHNCGGLTAITTSDNVTTIAEEAFAFCSGLINITIGNSVTSIGNSAFFGCSGLTAITTPDSVTSIESGAFYNCPNLKIIVLFPETPPNLGSTNAFSTTISTIYVQQSSKEAYKTAQYWNSFASKIVSDNIYLSFVRFNQKNKEYINGKVDELSTKVAPILSDYVDDTLLGG